MARTPQPRLSVAWKKHVAEHVNAVKWSPQGDQLAVALANGAVSIYKRDTGEALAFPEGHKFGAIAVSWSADGTRIASAGEDAHLRVWDANTGQQIWQAKQASSWVETVAWSPSGEWLAASSGKNLRIYNREGNLLREYPQLPSTLTVLIWSQWSPYLLAGGYGGVGYFNPTREQPHAERILPWTGGAIISMALSPTEKELAAGSQDGTIHFWYTDSGDDLQMAGYPLKMSALSWNHEGTFLAATGSNTVTVWNCIPPGPENTSPLVFERHEEPLVSVRFQHRGPLLASACQQGLVCLWYPGVARRVLSEAQISEAVSVMEWSQDDRHLLVGGSEGALVMYQV